VTAAVRRSAPRWIPVAAITAMGVLVLVLALPFSALMARASPGALH